MAAAVVAATMAVVAARTMPVVAGVPLGGTRNESPAAAPFPVNGKVTVAS
jgi:hypothetical protein